MRDGEIIVKNRSVEAKDSTDQATNNGLGLDLEHPESFSVNPVVEPDPNKQVKMDIEGLDLYYGDFQALHNNNLLIYKNEVTAFIGPSGSGKSTLLRSLNRMNDLVESCRVEGKVLLDGRDIYDRSYNVNELRRDVGMVFQQPNPFPKSLYDNIAYGPRTHGIKDKAQLDQIVEESLKGAAIWNEVKDKLDQNALSFSGGQQQRICIARALAVKPDVLLMDEPTSALDPMSTNAIEELVTELKDDYTIVIVTHNMQQAARISDRTAFFVSGALLEVDDTEVIFQNPSREETERYVSGQFG